MRSLNFKLLFLGVITILIAFLQRMNFEIYSVKPNFVLAWLSSLIVSSLSLYQIWILAVLAAILSAGSSYPGITIASLLISFMLMSWLAFKYLKRTWIRLIFTISLSSLLFFILSILLMKVFGENLNFLNYSNVFLKEIVYNILLTLGLALIMKRI